MVIICCAVCMDSVKWTDGFNIIMCNMFKTIYKGDGPGVMIV